MENNEVKKTDLAQTGDIVLFLEKNRRPLVVCIIAIALVCVGFVVTMVVFDELQKRAIADLEPLMERYEKILKSKEFAALSSEEDLQAGTDGALEAELTENLTEETEQLTEENKSVKEESESIEDFLAVLTEYAGGHSGYPAAEAWSIIAHLNAKQKKWPEAEAAYLKAAQTGAKTHLAPVAFFNAAVAAEEQNKREDAIKHYSASLEYPEFSQAAHAQFSIGRLHEDEDDIEAAIAAYQAVIDKWPKAENWTTLAHRQIISLEIIK
jgi:tetratricopeptide (TPR) repeat protein